MKPLVTPVYDCLEQILNDAASTEDEFECLSIQVREREIEEEGRYRDRQRKRLMDSKRGIDRHTLYMEN